MNVSDMRVMGRATQGVRLINIQDNDDIAAITKIDHEEDEAVENPGKDETTVNPEDTATGDTSANPENISPPNETGN